MRARSLVVVVWLTGCGPGAPPPSSGDPVAGEDVYVVHCTACHEDDLRGGARGTNLTIAADVSDDEMTRVIEDGAGEMPGFADELSDDDVRDVIAYIRGFQ